MSYSADSFVADEQPTTAKWNKLWTNDASFNDGTGIATGAITSAKISGIDKSLTTTDSNPYKFSAYRNAAWTTANSTFAKVNLDAELFDTNNNFDSTTDFRYTAPINGFYLFAGGFGQLFSASNAIGICTLYKNGSEILRGNELNNASVINTTHIVSGLLQLTAGDYIELYNYGNNKTGTTGSKQTYLHGFLVCRS